MRNFHHFVYVKIQSPTYLLHMCRQSHIFSSYTMANTMAWLHVTGGEFGNTFPPPLSACSCTITYNLPFSPVPRPVKVQRSYFVLASPEGTLSYHSSFTVTSMDHSFMQLIRFSMCYSTGSMWLQDDDDYKASSLCPDCDWF